MSLSQTLTTAAAVIALSIGVFACGEEAPAPAPTPAPEPVIEPPPSAPDTPAVAPATGLVTVASDGSRFDPPVQSAQIPPGAWMCDMGTVHYAALDPGEGTCPICNMQLVQQAAGGHAHHGEHEAH